VLIPQALFEQCLSIKSEIHESVELRDFGLRRRMLKLMPVVATGGIHVLREPNQAQYDSAITDKLIRSLEYETCRIREEV
jgi:hypothetical protein